MSQGWVGGSSLIGHVALVGSGLPAVTSCAGPVTLVGSGLPAVTSCVVRIASG